MRASAAVKAAWLAGLLPVLAVIVFPFVVMLVTALKGSEELALASFTWLPRHPRPANFVEVFQALPLARSFANSLLIAAGATLLNLLCAIPAGYALGRLRFPGRRGFLFGVLLTQMFSPIVLIIALFTQFTSYGLLVGGRVYLAWILVNAAVSLAFSIWLLTGYFSTVPWEVEEAALIDGCSRLQTVWRILLPMSLPGLVTVIIFAFIMAWNEYIFALTFTPADQYRPLTVAIPSFIGQYATQWQYLMAAALLATAPVIALFLTVEKHLIRGLTAGSIR